MIEKKKINFEECNPTWRPMQTSATKRQIWEYLSRGINLTDLLGRVPDEFFNIVWKWKLELAREYLDIYQECIDSLGEIPSLQLATKYGILEQVTRNISQSKYPQVLFALWHGRSFSQRIWRLIKPV